MESCPPLSCPLQSVTLRWHYPVHRWVWLSGDTILLTPECDSPVTLSCSPQSVTLRWHYPAHRRVWLTGDTILLTTECDSPVTLSCSPQSVTLQWLYPATAECESAVPHSSNVYGITHFRSEKNVLVKLKPHLFIRPDYDRNPFITLLYPHYPGWFFSDLFQNRRNLNILWSRKKVLIIFYYLKKNNFLLVKRFDNKNQ